MSEEEAARASRADKPMLVYVYEESDKEDEDPRLAVEGDSVFGTDEKVAVGARFFDCLRIDAESAAEDRVLAKHAKRAPVLVFIRPTFEVATAVRGKLSGSRVFGAMCSTLRHDYENCVNTVLKEQKRITKERTSLQRDRDRLTALSEKIGDERSASKRASMTRERDELDKKIAEAGAALMERESALYSLEPKSEA